MQTQLVLNSNVPLSLENMEVGDFLYAIGEQHRKDVTFSFYHGKTIIGKYPDTTSLMKWWLESLHRSEMGYALVHFRELGPYPQYIITIGDFVPHYYSISTNTPEEITLLETFMETHSKSHLFDVLARLDGKLALMVDYVRHKSIVKLVEEISYIRSNINVTNILRLLKKDGRHAKAVTAELTSRFWSEYQRNHICNNDYGFRADVESKDLTFLQIDGKHVHGYKKLLLPYAKESTAINLGYFNMYVQINNDKTYSLFTEIKGRGYRTMLREPVGA